MFDSIRRWCEDLPTSRYFLALALFFFAAGAYHTVSGLWLDRALEQEGREVEGIVLEKASGRVSTGKSSRSVYEVTVRFAPSRGEEVTDTVEIDHDVWEQLQEQDPIRVIYLPGDPAVHRVEGQDTEFQLWKLLLSLAAGGGLFYLSRLMRRDEGQP